MAQHYVGLGVLFLDSGLSAFIQNCVWICILNAQFEKTLLDCLSVSKLSCHVPFKKLLIKCGKHSELWLSLLGYFGL